MNLLPDDVLTLIFDHVSEEHVSHSRRAETFAHLCQVSRHFYDIAIGYLYHSVDLRRDRKQIVTTLARKPQLSRRIRELAFDYNDLQMGERSLFIQLLFMVLRQATGITRFELHNFHSSDSKNIALDTIFDMPFDNLIHMKLTGYLNEVGEEISLPLIESLALFNLSRRNIDETDPILASLETHPTSYDPIVCGLQDILIGIERRQGLAQPTTPILSTLDTSAFKPPKHTTSNTTRAEKRLRHLQYTDHRFPDASLRRCTPHLVRLQLSSLDLTHVPLVSDTSLVPLIIGLSPSLQNLRLCRVGFSPEFFADVAPWLGGLISLSCEPITHAQLLEPDIPPIYLPPIPLDARHTPSNSYEYHNKRRIERYLKTIMQSLMPTALALEELYIDFRCLSQDSPIILTDAFDQIKPPIAEKLQVLEIVGIQLHPHAREKFCHAPLRSTRLHIVHDNK